MLRVKRITRKSRSREFKFKNACTVRLFSISPDASKRKKKGTTQDPANVALVELNQNFRSIFPSDT